MGGKNKPFRRGVAKFLPQPKVLVICEDSKSGKTYLEDATKYFRVQVDVLVIHCGRTDPKGIVEAAIAESRNYDRIFCAIDRDTHESFDEALVLAKTIKNIDVIASYPCIELWYILHFKHTRRAFVRTGSRSPGECAVKELQRCDGLSAYAKGNSGNLFDFLLPQLADAKKRAIRVLKEALDDGEMNPCTRMHDLIDFFDRLSTPAPLDSLPSEQMP